MGIFVHISSSRIQMLRIETERLALCPFTEEDFAPWFACVGDQETARLMGGDWPETEAEARDLFHRILGNVDFFAIHFREGGPYLGHLSVSAPYPPVRALTSITGRAGVSVSYVVAPEYRRRGIAAEAVSGLIQWLFQEKRCDYVNCGYYEYNIASAALQRRLGFFPLSTHYLERGGERIKVVENILYRRENAT